MPYRRLPTTDKARLRALEAVQKFIIGKDPGSLAVSGGILSELGIIKTNFENHLKHHELNLKIESERNINYKQALEKARLYISHFIQVLLMTVEREEIKPEVLLLYGLTSVKDKVPIMHTEKEILEWGRKVISGEQQRMQKGGSPVYNPSIAVVKAKVEDFNEVAIFQSNLKRNNLRSFEKLQQLRKITNEFISRMWTEIETSLDYLPPKQKRQKAQEYGVVYVFRRNEKKKLKNEGLQVDLLFDFK
ncbi:MAG TPA: hypothetical protein VFD91_08975 [Mariniphaga sp.]|nr:hypothetical protein [Mariniphaga sp.]